MESGRRRPAGRVLARVRRAGAGSTTRLLAVFVLVLLVPVLGLGVALDDVYRTGARESALDAARASAQLVAQTSVRPVVVGQDLDTGLDIAGVADLGASSDAAVREGRLIGLRLLSPGGTVVFPPQDVGLRPTSQVLDDIALTTGGHAPAEVTTAQRPQWAGGGEVQAVHVYASVVDSRGAVVGVLEVLLPYDHVAQDAERRAATFVVVLLVGLGALYAVVVVLAVVVTRRLRRQLADTDHQAHHDSLTGLPNRKLFRERARQAASAEGRTAVVAVVDLDRFKQVNDTLGHEAGDELLRRVAEHLLEAVRTDDTVARLGGDEFGLVLPGVTLETAGPVLAHVQEALHRPVRVGDHVISVSGSIGVAVAPDHGRDVEELLRRADASMYTAKRSGRGVVVAQDEPDAAALDDLLVPAELDAALLQDELRLHYQPLVDLRTGRADRVEALVRWQHPRRGLLGPGQFLPLAESTGQVDALTTWVLRRALADLARMPAGTVVAVNVPPSSLQRSGFADEVVAALREAGVAPDRLVLEMTETQVVRDVGALRCGLSSLRAAGVGLALDDFGQGSTSLSVLADLPFTEVKVDRCFVAALPDGEVPASIITAVVAIARAAGMLVVAEGVEEAETLERVRSLGCDLAQGYHLGRPAPLPAPVPVPVLARVAP